MAMYLLTMGTETISLIFLGRAPGTSSNEIAGLGLGNLVYNCAGLAVGFGFTGSQDTLVTQAFGRGDIELCKLYLHRCQVWMFVVFLASSVVIGSTESLLAWCQVTDSETAHHAGVYCRLCILSLVGTFQYSALRKFCLATGDAKAGLFVQLVAVPLHALWCTLLVPRFRVQGVGLAMVIKGWTELALLAVYASCVNRKKDRHGWWRFWRALRGRRAWEGMREYLFLAVPSVALCTVEWWAWEFLGLFAGYLRSPDKLAAHVTTANMGSILYLAGTGAQKAASVLVGAACGRSNKGEMHMVARAAMFWNLCCCFCMGGLMLAFRRPLAEAYNPSSASVQGLLVGLSPFLALQGLFDGINQCIQGTLSGLGLQKKASQVSLFCYWMVMVPVAALLAFPMQCSLAGLWMGCNLASIVAIILNACLYRRSDFAAIAHAASVRMELDVGGAPLASPELVDEDGTAMVAQRLNGVEPLAVASSRSPSREKGAMHLQHSESHASS